jgi:hypothetical protein
VTEAQATIFGTTVEPTPRRNLKGWGKAQKRADREIAGTPKPGWRPPGTLEERRREARALELERRREEPHAD